MRVLSRCAAVIATWAALVWVYSALLPGQTDAQAQTLPALQGQVTDLTRDQVLAGQAARLDPALASLLQQHNVQLFVLFIESTGGRTVTAFADETARQNSLGGNDVLLVVAVADRSDALWRPSQSVTRLTDGELQDVLTRRVEPLLARGDFGGAVVAAANGLGQVAGTGSQTSAGGSSGSGAGAGWLFLPLLLGGGGLLAWRAFVSRRRQQGAARASAQETARLVHEANALLIAVDERLRDARDELGFVEAQFGEAEVAPYREAVGRAADELKAAFTLRQQLDDAQPESDEEQRRIATEATAHARTAQGLLDEQAQRVAQLRDLERTAPEVLAALPARIEALAARLPQAEQTLASLRRYAEASLAAVLGNTQATGQALAQARTAVADGQTALSRDDRAAAGRQVRAAQQALTEATRLLDAIDSLAASLRQADATVRTQLAAATADVASARTALVASGQQDDGRLAQADALLQQAERKLAQPRPDVLAASLLVTQADGTTDVLLAELQQDAERRARARRLLDDQVQTAAADYDRVADFIASNRQYIGSAPRTRLAEGARHLQRARDLTQDTPDQALTEARRAQELIGDAYARAVEDVQGDEPFGGGWGSPLRGGVILPIPFPIPVGGGGWGDNGGGMSSGGGSSVGDGGGAVGGRW